MPKYDEERRRLARKLHRVYRQLPGVRCRGLCGPLVCHEAVPLCPDELRLVELVTGKPIPDAPNGRCAFYDESSGSCGIYNERPLICRIYGARGYESIELKWTCPHGCEPIAGPPPLQVMEVLSELIRPDLRSTNGKVNRALDDLGASFWSWEGRDLVAVKISDEGDEDTTDAALPGIMPGTGSKSTK